LAFHTTGQKEIENFWKEFAEEAIGPSNRDIKGWKNGKIKSFIR